MADELDPRLEARLRDVLRHEADTLPFTLTLAEVEAAGRARHAPITRLRVPVALLASAAAVAIVVGGLIAWRGATLPPVGTESPNPLAGELASYEELAAGISLIDGVVIARGEELVGAPDAGEAVIGTIPANAYVDIVFDCRGGGIEVGLRLDGEAGGRMSKPCDGAAEGFSSPGFTRDGAEVVVKADPGTVWRLVVGGGTPSGPTPRPASLSELPSFEEIAAVASSSTEIARAEGDAQAEDSVVEILKLGDLWKVEVAWACIGDGEVVIEHTTPSGSSGTIISCGDGKPGTTWKTDPTSERSPGAAVVMNVPAGVAWRVIVYDPKDQSSSFPLASFTEVAAVALSTREVARAAGGPEPTDAVIEIARLGDLWNTEIALACTGPGSIDVSTTGTPDAQSTSTFDCSDGAVPASVLVALLDTAAERSPDAALVASVPAGTAWRAIVFDHSADLRPMPKAPAEPFPMTDVGGFTGLVHRDGTPAVTSTTRPIPAGATIEVAMGCTGDPSSLVRIVLDGVAADLACLVGNVWLMVPDGDGTSELQVSANGTVWVDIAMRAFTRVQAGAAVAVPMATLVSESGTSKAQGFTTCLLAFAIPGGASADEGCGPTAYRIPDARTVRARAGESLALVPGIDWTITGATSITYVPSSAAGDLPPGEPVGHPAATRPGGEGDFSIAPLPAGDWTLRIDVAGTLADGTTFTAEQLFRVIVEP